ncbi:DNA polymerase eta-like protein [Sarcoptes scabiei]|uniref:DNA polymerase eta n=1 Tax=Sarcoptes scabiei TaxID=52283 RepID=A0A132A3J8_SARSC|nr:DNA polymerase eta-like protein [Sarcoptes scabiei]
MDNPKRIIALIDMDCFYVQCEQRLQPDKWSKPCAVAQYNNWRGGGIIAVNYEARSFGVRRGMRGDEAERICPGIHIFAVPDVNGKAKLDRYRDGSAEVFQTINDFIIEQERLHGPGLIILERASVDEAFLDLTKLIDAKPLSLPSLEELIDFNTKLEFDDQTLSDWYNRFEEDSNDLEEDIRLIMGAHLTGQIRKMILERTQFRCSAGISHNKMLSKLACGINKPNAQTILPMSGVPELFNRVKISDVRSLGGKLGHQIKQVFSIRTMSELSEIEQSNLEQFFDSKTAKWLQKLACGYDDEPVLDRKIAKSIGCGKMFRGKNALVKWSDIHKWIQNLSLQASKFIDAVPQNKKIDKFFKRIDKESFIEQAIQMKKIKKNDDINVREQNQHHYLQNYFKSEKFSKDQPSTSARIEEERSKESNCNTNCQVTWIEQQSNDDSSEAGMAQTEKDLDLLMDSFFFRKILTMIENNELDDFLRR